MSRRRRAGSGGMARGVADTARGALPRHHHPKYPRESREPGAGGCNKQTDAIHGAVTQTAARAICGRRVLAALREVFCRFCREGALCNGRRPAPTLALAPGTAAASLLCTYPKSAFVSLSKYSRTRYQHPCSSAVQNCIRLRVESTLARLRSVFTRPRSVRGALTVT